MHDCQPWVAVLLTNRVTTILKGSDQKLGKLKLKKNACNFSFEITDNEKKGNLQELRHNAYQ